MGCAICTHKKRAQIEADIRVMNLADSASSFKKIAETYKVDVKALQVHALMHVATDEPNGDTSSLADKIKLNEAFTLKKVINENYTTLINTGAKINAILNEHTTASPTVVLLSKPLVELYLGCSQVIRDATDSIVKMNLIINGEQNNGLQGLAALVDVLKSPVKKT